MGGGQTLILGGMKNATTCQVKLLSHQGFPVVYATNVRPCTTTFTAKVAIGRNVSLINRTVGFVLIARNPTSVFRGYFFLTLMAANAKGVATTTTTTPPTTTPPRTVAPVTTPPNTGGAGNAGLDAWVTDTLSPDAEVIAEDLGAINNCVQANGGEEGCESDGSQLANDAQSSQGDPSAPVTAVQNTWYALLTDNVNVGSDIADDDDATADAQQDETDCTDLINILAGYGITVPSL